VTERDELDETQRRMRELLRGAADVGPMPEDVVARLDAALEAARPATPVASLSRRRARLPRLLAAAAGIAVIGGGAWFATQSQFPSSESSTTAAGSMASGSSESLDDTRILLSGKDYADVAAVQDLAEESLGQDVQAPAADATPGAESLESKPNLLSAPQSDESATSDPSQRPAAEQAVACAKQLDVDPEQVVVVEMASYQGTPAAFVVEKTDDGAEVVVVARDCEPGDAALSRVTVP
jgi:hypothetical protein